MYDGEDADGNFNGGDPDGPIDAPHSKAVIKAWLTKASFIATIAFGMLAIGLIGFAAPCGTQIAATGLSTLFAGLLIPFASSYFA